MDAVALDVDTFELDMEVRGGDICGVTTVGSFSASTFCKGAPLPLVPASVVGAPGSREEVAAGVRGGECNVDVRGLPCGEGLVDEVCVGCRLGSRELSSRDGTY